MKLCRKKIHTYPKEYKQCLECVYIRNRVWQKANHEYVKNYHKNWYKINAVKQKNSAKEYRNINKEKIKECMRNWQKANKEYMVAYTRERELAKLQRTPKWLTEEDRAAIKEFYTSAKELEKIFGIKYHVDHIIPIKGKNVSGLHVPWNLQLLTAKENQIKGNKIQKELL